MEQHTEEAYEYDCVICSVDRAFDRSVSERLLKEIQSYKLPRSRLNDTSHLPYHRVWCHVLGASDTLTEATWDKLKKTRWVLLVCSGSVKESLPCAEVLRYFHGLGRKMNLLPLLIEGDPQQSFPSLFFEERETRLISEDGSEQILREVIEPLAVDIRADKPEASLKLISHARIKIVAALIGVSYDTLEQRHFKRARKRLVVLTSALILIPVILASIFTYLWLHAEQQITLAEQKTKIASDLFTHMMTDYPEKFKEIPEAVPLVNEMLITNLVTLKEAESTFINHLDIGDLLHPGEEDSYDLLVSKATLLRYTSRSEEALSAYKLAAALKGNSDVYSASSEAFVRFLDPYEFPIGICVLAIDPEVSQKCGGLAAGDIIVAIGGFRFRSMDQYNIAKTSHKPDKPIAIEILRPSGDGLVKAELQVKPQDLVFTPAIL